MKKIFAFLLLFCHLTAHAQQQFARIGEFKTTGGGVISDCRVGYRTLGRLNAERSNAVLWPTWFGGTSEQLVGGAIPGAIDTSGLFIIAVDALGNGVSSSPSNTPDFPDITVRDLVNSQHELLVKHLKINHLSTVMGISMGGMQTFEWLLVYSGFMDKAVSIVGTPKQSAYDLLLWRTEADLIEKAGNNLPARLSAMEEVLKVHALHLQTPAYWARTEKPENLDAKLAQISKSRGNLHPDDWLCQLKVMMKHDIYSSSGKSLADLKSTVRARVLVIAAKRDLMVNPAPSVEFAGALGCELLEPDNDCGHIPGMCEGEMIRRRINGFLKNDPPQVIRLYPGKAPGSENWDWEEKENNNNLFQTKVIYNVSTPTLTAFLPDPAIASGTAVVICPGGGFHTLSIEREGFDVARWLAERGVAAFVLKYRLVRSKTDDPVGELLAKLQGDRKKFDEENLPTVKMAIADGKAAITYLRAHAAEFGISRVGIMGFSAGGSLTAGVAYSYTPDCRPDFVAPIYGYNRAFEKMPVPADAPPMFLAVATDDPLGFAPLNTQLYNDWIAAGISAELHVYAKGGHGFGMRKQNLPTDRWIERFGEWLALNGWMK